MSQSEENVNSFLALINLYPSPHNGQPIRLKWLDSHSFDLYFQKERGLQATDISFLFSFVSMGVFVEHMTLSADALGHTLTYSLNSPRESDLHGVGVVRFAHCQIQWDTKVADTELLKTLQFRQTSRKKYSAGIDQLLSETIVKVASENHMQLTQLSQSQAHKTIWLNQRAVFDDMFDEPVRHELDHWLRYTQHEKEASRDGLAYDCMELNGSIMKYIVEHPRLLRAPGIAWLIKQYYLRTMTDKSDVFYMMAPFASEHDAFAVGVVIMKIWKEVARKGYYLHPFGTIMSNAQAHRDFLSLAHVQDELRATSYLVFIFRCGRSEPPHRSLRIPYTQHLIME